jgi:NDP-sugar pyrophosphorylase family protein
LVLARVPEASRFGSVRVDRHGRLTQFQEKTDIATGGWINAGIYLLERSAIEEIPLGRALSLERDLFPAWLDSRGIYGFRSARRFLDIGTPEAYVQAESFFPCTQGS